MNKEILYTMATDENGDLIHIDDAIKGSRYYCPLCKGEFILRKSGKTGKGSKRPHFAHNELTPNCTPEGVLHYSFRKLLLSILIKHQSEDKTLAINWRCSICNGKYTGNILAKVASIKEEYNLVECRPDIALLDEDEGVVAVVEIVVTHKPEESVLQYYKMNHIVLIQIDVSSEDDLKRVEEKAKNPSTVELCLNSKCTNYGNIKTRRDLLIGTKMCNACFGLINVCTVRTSHVFGILHSTDFSENEIELAKAKGVRFEMRVNDATNEDYPQIICWNCKKIRSRFASRRF
jgi:hypothetical protein